MAQYKAPESLHIGNGSETVFGFAWPYLKASDIYVTVNEVTIPTVLVGTAQVSIQPAPAAGAEVRIYRDTPAQDPYYLFDTGIPFMPRYVDTNNKQLLHAVQEGLLEFAKVKAVALEALALAQVAKAQAERAETKADKALAGYRRTLRVKDAEPSIRELPSVAARGNKILGFNDIGEPVGVIPVSGSAAEILLDLASNADHDLGAGMIGRFGGGTVQDSLDTLFTRNDFTHTYMVGPGADFATINEGLRVLSLRHGTVFTGAPVQIELRLQSGYVIREQTLLSHGINLGFITITAEDVSVEVDPSAITVALSTKDDIYPVFGGIRSELPTIGFQMHYPSAVGNRDGVSVLRGSRVEFLPGAGVDRARRGLTVGYFSKAFCYPLGLTQGGDGTGAGLATGVNFRYCTARALHVAYHSEVGLARSMLHDCTGDYAAYVIWRSTADLYQSNASRTANGTAFNARDGSEINARESNGSRSRRAYHALHYGRINARSRITGPTMIWIGEGAQYCSEYGVLAHGKSQIEAADLNASFCSGSAGVSASGNSEINFEDGRATDCANRGVWAQSSRITAHRVDVSRTNIGFQLTDGGMIAAVDSIATDCLQFGALGQGGGELILTRANVSRSERGVETRDGTALTARNLLADSCKNRAVSAIDGSGTVNVQDATLTNAGLRAITARNGAQVNAVGADCSGAGSWAVEVQQGSQVTFNGGNPGTAPLSQTPNITTQHGVIYTNIIPGPGPDVQEIIAHRGFGGLKPGNTMVAYENARALGNRKWETDVSVSSDGVMYCFHARTVDSATTGTGTFTQLTSGYLDSLEIKAGSSLPEAPIRIAKFSQYLALAAASGASVNFELKRLRSNDDIPMIVQAAVDANLQDRTEVSAFDLDRLRIVRELNTRVGLGVICDDPDPTVLKARIDEAAALGNATITASVAVSLANPSLVQYAFARSVGWATWTVNDLDTVAALRAIGVLRYISDYNLQIPA